MASWRFLRQLLGFGEIAVPGHPHFFILLTIHEDLPQTKKQTFQDMEICTTYERVYVTNTLHLSGSIRIFFKKRTVADNSTKTS
jgi:hypothetical protein